MGLRNPTILFCAAVLAASETASAQPLKPPPDREVYTLYRSSVVLPNARLHIATFDFAGEGRSAYNMENCQLASGLFQQQPGVKTRFWCEQGRYRP